MNEGGVDGDEDKGDAGAVRRGERKGKNGSTLQRGGEKGEWGGGSNSPSDDEAREHEAPVLDALGEDE